MMYVRTIMRRNALLAILVLSGCTKLMPPAPADDELLDGPVAGLSGEETALFLAGDAAFNAGVFTASSGLGPLFVAPSCGACHPGDGKGHPENALTRFGQAVPGSNDYLDQGGPQLQHRAIPGHTAEDLPAGAPFSKLVAPANTGLGFLDAVPDATLLALADPDDLDGDGISGTPNWIVPPAFVALRSGAVFQAERTIGRFGKKAATYDLLQQTATAYQQDMGVLSVYQPLDTYNGLEGDPEVATATVHEVVFYLRTLKAPVQRDRDDADVQFGEQLFNSVGCAACHVPEITTGTSSVVALANTTVRPFTDLLLRDMGAELDDGYTEGNALSAEWRTPPLWGLGLAGASQGGVLYLLHDGRAGSIEQAIDLHGGESAASRTAFQELGSEERAAVIRFLESL